MGSSAWLHIISMLGRTAGLAFPQRGCFHQLCVYPSTLAHPSACTGSLFSLPALLRGLRSTESRNPSDLCVCVCVYMLYSFMLLALTEELPLKDLNGASFLSLFCEVSVSTRAPGCTDMLHLCITNHLKTKYPIFDPHCALKTQLFWSLHLDP